MNKLTSRILYSIYAENQGKNWVFSPASYMESLASVALCTKGNVLDEIMKVAPNVSDNHVDGLDSYNCTLISEEYAPVIVSSILLSLIKRGADIRLFKDASVVDEINRIVYQKTHGKISNLLSPDDMSGLIKLIVLNCVYFKAAWRTRFDEQTISQPFYGVNSTTQVCYLHKQSRFRYYEDADVDIVELPYDQSDVCCYLVVPKDSLFKTFSDLSSLMNKLGKVSNGLDCYVTVPPFKTETTFSNLAGMTAEAGMPHAFTPSKDWSIFDFEALNPEAVMWVEKVIQKTYLDFTKDGTEAAAATVWLCAFSGCCMDYVEPPPVKTIRADKPFVYVLANRNQPDKPLFVGVVNDVR